MGLESHVDEVIERDAPHLRSFYFWRRGLKAMSEDTARQIAKVLDESGEFGETTIKFRSDQEVSIEFETHPDFQK